MTLRARLLLALLIPGLLVLLIGGIGLSALGQLERAAGRILANNYQTIQAAREMESALRRLEVAGGQGHVAALAARVEGALVRCERNVTEVGEPEVLGALRAGWDPVAAALLRGVPPREALGDRAAVEALHEAVASLIALNEGAMMTSEARTRSTGRWAKLGVAVALGAALLALVVFAVIAARRIAEPVTAVADRLHAALDVGERPGAGTDGRPDELRRLQTEMDALLGRLAAYEDEHARRLTHLQGRLALVMNEVLEGLVLLDADLRVLSVNRVARAILGAGPPAPTPLTALPLRDDVRAVLAPVLGRSFQAERDLGELRFVLDDQERVFRPRVVTVAAPDGAVEGYLLLFWDVTEQRRFEESRRRFVAMLSHQLKTPMTSLSLSVHLLRERLADLPPAQAELLSIAGDDCDHLARLIGELIDASRDVGADLSVRARPVELVALLRSALRPLLPQSEAAGIALRLPEGREVVRVDPVKFPWVVTNIAGNALRYTPPGGTVRVTVAGGPTHVEVTVADTGVGIAEEALATIFEPFVSADEAPQAGTHGLGLAIAREIVLAHRGTIAVESRVGHGTTFRIRIPLEARLASGERA